MHMVITLTPLPFFEWVVFSAGGKLSTPWGDGSWGAASSTFRPIYMYVYTYECICV